MISKAEERLIFLKLELNETNKIVKLLREDPPKITGDLKEWEHRLKMLTDEVFELEVLSET